MDVGLIVCLECVEIHTNMNKLNEESIIILHDLAMNNVECISSLEDIIGLKIEREDTENLDREYFL